MDPGREVHISDEDLERYSLNGLPEPDLAVVEEHLLVCPACQDRLEATDAYVRAMREAAVRARREELPLRRPGGRPQPMMAVAAAAALLVAAGVAMRSPGSPPSAADVPLEANRGPMAAHSQAPAGRPLVLRMDIAELAPQAGCRVEVVDEQGRRLWDGPAVLLDGRLAVTVSKPFSPGRYYVRLYSPSSELLREYGLETR